MRHRRVRDVMTTEVVSIREGTSFKRIVALMAGHQVSGVPVLGADDRVVGVVSEADLLAKEEQPDPRGLTAAFGGRRSRTTRAKAGADIAGDLMSAPAVTIDADAQIGQAARLMDRHRIKRLPVVDSGGHLVGIVSRRDLLRVFLRPDEEIRTEVARDVVAGILTVDPVTVSVEVTDGVVTLRGQLERKTLTLMLVHLTRAVDGVVDVVDRLSFAFDDTRISPTDT